MERHIRSVATGAIGNEPDYEEMSTRGELSHMFPLIPPSNPTDGRWPRVGPTDDKSTSWTIKDGIRV